MSIRIVAAIAAAITLFTASARADTPFPAAEEAAIVQLIEAGMTAQRQPGLIVGISIPGRGEFTRAFGVGDIATKAPMKPEDHVRIASITKSFVAVAALRLVDQGKLKLDDTLATWITGIPNGDKITIRDLLGMRSGIYDFTSDRQFLADFTADPLMTFSPQDVVAIVNRHEPDFAPGEKVAYCDTNYIFLGMIIEKVTRKPVEDVIREEIIAPLKLADTSFPTASTMPEPFARGYYAGEDGKGAPRDFTASNPAVAWSAGAMISTLDDLRIWSKALATGALLKPQTHAEQMKFGAIATKPIHVGYGLGIADFGGLIGHNGAIFGYTTAMFYVAAADATIVIEGNLASNFSNSATDIAYALAKRLMPDLIE
ncbi:MAG: serine hydrolase domain-containing protein [Hyphomicrobiales bacterium]